MNVGVSLSLINIRNRPMPEEWFEVAYINFDKAILHGRVSGGIDENRVRVERFIEQVLTDEQRKQISYLGAKHDREMQRLLRGFADRSALSEKE